MSGRKDSIIPHLFTAFLAATFVFLLSEVLGVTVLAPYIPGFQRLYACIAAIAPVITFTAVATSFIRDDRRSAAGVRQQGKELLSDVKGGTVEVLRLKAEDVVAIDKDLWQGYLFKLDENTSVLVRDLECGPVSGTRIATMLIRRLPSISPTTIMTADTRHSAASHQPNSKPKTPHGNKRQHCP